MTQRPVRAVCVDGPLRGAQVSFAAAERRRVLHHPVHGALTYELTGALGFPGGLATARLVQPRPAGDRAGD